MEERVEANLSSEMRRLLSEAVSFEAKVQAEADRATNPLEVERLKQSVHGARQHKEALISRVMEAQGLKGEEHRAEVDHTGLRFVHTKGNEKGKHVK